MKILIINGPNLNLLGKREPEIYGSRDFNSFLTELKFKYKGVELVYFQSNHCGEIIDVIQTVNKNYQGIILNAGAYSHTSLALGDALSTVKIPCVEVHISNIYAREPFRNNSYLSRHCKAHISGLGLYGYEAALIFLLKLKS